MQKFVDNRVQQVISKDIRKSCFRAINPDSSLESCENCTYGEQDIDTFPCAKCHTRH